MRWCFFSPGYRSVHVLEGDSRTSGGAEAQIAHIAAALAQLGNEVSLIYGDGRRSRAETTIAGVRCYEDAPAWRNPGSLWAFWRRLSALSPDQIYARLPNDFLWIAGWFAWRRSGTRFLYALAHDLHCSPWSAFDHKKWFHCPLYALGLRSADVIATQHDGQKGLLNPSLQSRAVFIPNLVRATEDRPRDYDATVYDAVWVAQIRPEKQLNLFLELAKALPSQKFAVVGRFDPETPAADRVRLEACMWQLPNLTFLGALRADAVSDILRKSKILVNTSSSEGFPNTMLEAWSLGVPVASLTVDPGGVISREGLGLVGGTVDGLAHHVWTLASERILNQDLGARGLDYVRRQHSLSAVCGALGIALPPGSLPRAQAKIDVRSACE